MYNTNGKISDHPILSVLIVFLVAKDDTRYSRKGLHYNSAHASCAASFSEVKVLRFLSCTVVECLIPILEFPGQFCNVAIPLKIGYVLLPPEI